jgi:hypothetical protein
LATPALALVLDGGSDADLVAAEAAPAVGGDVLAAEVALVHLDHAYEPTPCASTLRRNLIDSDPLRRASCRGGSAVILSGDA